jgi:thiol:disulfide interchange protein
MQVHFSLNCVLAAFLASAAAAQAAHTQAKLLLSADTARPGDTILAGIHLRMDPHWHTYWRNPGASGKETTVKWELPAGIAASELQWPVPEKLPPADLTTYVYENEVILSAPLKLAPGLKPGAYEIKAAVSWLECKELCIPGSAELTATIQVGDQTKLSADESLLQSWQKKLPRAGTNLAAKASWEKSAHDSPRQIILEWAPGADLSDADFYPFPNPDFEVQAATEKIPAGTGKIRLRKEVNKFEGEWPQRISGLLIQKSGGETIAYEATLPIASSTGSTDTEPGHGTLPPQSLWKMLLYAFIGGLILNVMPCVLPVIALKILGFVGEARTDSRHVRKLGVVYALGVLTSFLVLAGLVIAVKAAGHKAGWGMQFGNPQFLVILTVLMTLIALNLFGVFEINLGGRVMGAAGTLGSKQGMPGAFFNGVLATVLATPCTAPFLGAALGFAFAQRAGLIILMFLTVGAGLAFPYVVLSWRPAWLKFLPKPGPWMERFKIAMGFPLLATAVWIFSLVPLHYAKRSWWLGIFLVIVALAVWIYGEFIQRGRTRRGLAMATAILLLVAGYLYAIEGQLNWRHPVPVAIAQGSLKESPGGIDWQSWSPAAVIQAQEAGHPVLVDFTADWCLTCQANKKIALEIPSVRAKLKELGAVALLGDYTRLPDSITTELNRYGRAGVPLVLVYPGKAGAQPAVLPEVLTPGIVIEALERAAK